MSAEPPELGNVFVSNYPPYSFWDGSSVTEAEAALGAPPRPETPLGLYLHIPFCRRRCSFCYFRVYTDKDARQIVRYLDALAREVRLYAERPAIAGRPLEFVYFGGGTPSYVSVEHLGRLVAALTAEIPWTGAREITFECEPGTLTRPKLEAIRGIGVTRLSLGIESFDDQLLEWNGRAHRSAEIARVRPWIREIGFDQLNVDLIAGMLGETWDTWRASVEKTIEYAPESVTIYQMELPLNTVFSTEVAGGGTARPLLDWATKRALHGWAIERLEEAGFERSSAYTMVRRGAGSSFVYRDAVWNGADMLGTGVASFSHLSGVHFQNSDRWDRYLEEIEAGRLPIERGFRTSASERLTRELILQLKFGRIERGKFRDKFGVDVVERFGPALDDLERARMLDVEDDHIELTREGLLRVDHLLPRFYADRYQNARYT